MSEEPGQDDQMQEQAPKWGEAISPERQAELRRYLDRWHAETDHGDYKGPFDWNYCKVQLTGADVSWLAEQSGKDERDGVPNLHLENANLNNAHLEEAHLSEAHLEEAHLRGARLERAYLRRVHLEHAYLREAHLEGATLTLAHLERATLTLTHLERATLIATWFDKYSLLNDAILTGVSLDQVSFDQTNLTVVNWSLVDTLGDEQAARKSKDASKKTKDRTTRLEEYKSAVRANRVLAVALQAQGLNEDASRFAYHAQVLQREVYRRQRKFGAYLFSLLIAALAGYGYRLGRILISYALIVSVFAAGYFFTGHTLGSPVLTMQSAVQGVLDAFQISLNAIHGRVFFAQFGLDTAQSWLATAESIVGIVIEGVFVAMLIQRFFGR